MTDTGLKHRVPAGSEAASLGPSAVAQEGPHVVRLLPSQPPGRCTRKALSFTHEIRRLHAMGYTLEAIRKALSEAGVSVSRSTVHREATRRAEPASLPLVSELADKDAPAMPAPPPSGFSESAEAKKASMPLSTDRRSGKDIAEAFFRNHPTNPLLHPKERQ